MKTLTKNLLLLASLSVFALVLAARFPEMEKGIDFPDFYCAARMVHEGMGRQLYDPAVQRVFQERYAGRVGTYFIHPAFETLVYLPFALAAPERAYLLWCLFNLGLLISLAKVLGPLVFRSWDWQIVLILMLSFAPVLADFIQGQDSVLLLFFFVMAFIALKAEREATAGILLGCALFKFQLAVPLAFVIAFCVRRRGRFMSGFTAAAAALTLLSVAISGWGLLTEYPRFLAQLKDLPMAGVHPAAMANLRGLFSLLVPTPGLAQTALITWSSLLVLAFAVRGWHGEGSSTKLDLGFSAAVIAALLVSYHLNVHDLSLLLLPMILLFPHVRRGNTAPQWLSRVLPGLLLILFLPPLHVWLVIRNSYAYMSVGLLCLFMAVVVWMRLYSPIQMQIPASISHVRN